MKKTKAKGREFTNFFSSHTLVAQALKVLIMSITNYIYLTRAIISRSRFEAAPVLSREFYNFVSRSTDLFYQFLALSLEFAKKNLHQQTNFFPQ